MIFDGKKTSQSILTEIKNQVDGFSFQPIFCDILAGNDAVSESYVKIKGRAARSVGIDFKVAKYPAEISETDLIAEIQKLNTLPGMCGLIVQLPLPESLNSRKILDSIDPRIDVDAMGSQNSQKFFQGSPGFIPPTAAAIMHILDSQGADFHALSFLVIGQGELVGRPVTYLLKKRGYNVAVADRNTNNLRELLKKADVIISAAGRAKLFGGTDIKPGAIVIDAGSSEQNGSIAGDADFESVSKIAGFVTPVPGGVGPVTVAMLLKNVAMAAKNIKI